MTDVLGIASLGVTPLDAALFMPSGSKPSFEAVAGRACVPAPRTA